MTDPGRELHEYPVMPGKNWLLCNPLLSLIQQDNVNVSGGWSIWQRDEWSWIGGIRQPSIGNTTDTWEYQFSNRYTRYGFYGSHFLFLQIKNVTKEDNGSIYRYQLTAYFITCFVLLVAYTCKQKRWLEGMSLIQEEDGTSWCEAEKPIC